MEILFLTQVLPYPLDAGPKLRAYYVLRYLAERHAISLVSFVRTTDRGEHRAHLEEFCEQVVTVEMKRSRLRDLSAYLTSLASGRPFLIQRDQVAPMTAALHKLVRERRFDLVHADQLWMADYALQARQAAVEQGYRPAIVLDQHNAVYLIPQRMADDSRHLVAKRLLRGEAQRMARYEQTTCQQFDRVVWVTHEDRQAVSRLPGLPPDSWPAERNPVIPICIDPLANERIEPTKESQAVLFVGGMHWPPNADGVRWFVHEVWPLVRSKAPQARFIAVGKAPPEELANSPGVTAPGYVDDPATYWNDSNVFVVPLRAAGGMRVKILDAWGRGLPVISTTIGAEGIACTPGRDILIADQPGEFAQAILAVLDEPLLSRQIRDSAWQTVSEKYDWRSIYQAFDQVYC